MSQIDIEEDDGWQAMLDRSRAFLDDAKSKGFGYHGAIDAMRTVAMDADGNPARLNRQPSIRNAA